MNSGSKKLPRKLNKKKKKLVDAFNSCAIKLWKEEWTVGASVTLDGRLACRQPFEMTETPGKKTGFTGEKEREVFKFLVVKPAQWKANCPVPSHPPLKIEETIGWMEVVIVDEKEVRMCSTYHHHQPKKAYSLWQTLGKREIANSSKAIAIFHFWHILVEREKHPNRSHLLPTGAYIAQGGVGGGGGVPPHRNAAGR